MTATTIPIAANSFALPVPANLVEFIQTYGTDDACRQALVKARWPAGFVCPRCAHKKGYELRGYPVIECESCGHQASATAGTLLHGSKLPLSKLFLLLYLLVAEKDGANCCQLKRQLGVNYKTARLWTLKLRDMLYHRDKDSLVGRVEVDETIVGAGDGTNIGRKLGKNQSYVLVMVEDKGDHCGRLRLQAVGSATTDELTTAVECDLAKGATARTDGLNAYAALKDSEIVKHKPVVVGDPKNASKKLPLVHLVASLLKRFMMGTCQGSVAKRWLPWLLSEFEFRFNRRNSSRRPLLFARLMELGQHVIGKTRRYFAELGQSRRQLGLA